MRRIVLEGPRGLRLDCSVAERRRDRARGLIGSGPLDPGETLLIPRASSVHTFGMSFPIVVARLDDGFRVVDVRGLRPRRILAPSRRVRHVLECATGIDLRVGDALRIRPAGPGAASSGPQPRVAILPRLSPAARAPIV